MTETEHLAEELVSGLKWSHDQANAFILDVQKKAEAELGPEYKGTRRTKAIQAQIRAKVLEQLPPAPEPTPKKASQREKLKPAEWRSLMSEIVSAQTKDGPATTASVVAAVIEKTGVTEGTALSRIHSFLGWTDDYETKRVTVVEIRRVK